MDYALVACSIATATVAGAFFVFSNFVMKALGRLVDPEGVRAMQSINVVVLNPGFMAVFMGTGLLCAGVAVASVLGPSTAERAPAIVGAAIYLVGVIGVTGLGNVPLNDRLAAADASQATELWSHYLERWTFLNHVRTTAAWIAAATFALAVVDG